jgi:signal peptidase I
MRRPGLVLGAVMLVGAFIAGMPALARLRRSWPNRVAVESHSMEPTLIAGDWLLVDPLTYRARSPRPGELVVIPDPRLPARWLIKRLTRVTPDGQVTLASDHPAHAGERLPPVPAALLIGRPWLRYWPPRRIGRL